MSVLATRIGNSRYTAGGFAWWEVLEAVCPGTLVDHTGLHLELRPLRAGTSRHRRDVWSVRYNYIELPASQYTVTAVKSFPRRSCTGLP